MKLVLPTHAPGDSAIKVTMQIAKGVTKQLLRLSEETGKVFIFRGFDFDRKSGEATLHFEPGTGYAEVTSDCDSKAEAIVVWIVGQVLDGEGGDASQWQFAGVFRTEPEAVAACRDATYFVGPATVGVALPHDSCEWAGAYYPISETANTAVGKPTASPDAQKRP